MMDHKPLSVTHLSCGCDWDGKHWWYCAQHEHPDAAPVAWRTDIIELMRQAARALRSMSVGEDGAVEARAFAIARHLEDRAALYAHPEDAPGGPKVVCLCGSTRFYDAFQRANYEETMQGRIVLSVGFYPHSQTQAHGEEVGCTEEQKYTLDDLHLRKIDLADEILVLNVGGYVGESTTREIEYAMQKGKPIRFLEPVRDALNRLRRDMT